MTIGNFLEVLGTDRNDSLTGSDLEIIYGDSGGDSLVAGSRINSNPNLTNILVGGTGRNAYSVRDNATAIIVENSGSTNNTLYTTIISSGINTTDDSFIVADIDSQHLYLGNKVSHQYALLIDWQQPANRIENFYFTNAVFSYDSLANSYQNLDGYQENLTWEELEERGLIDLARLDIEPASIDDSLNTIIERSLNLEGIEETNNNSQIGTPINNNQAGNFLEVLGTDGFDSISGEDLQIVYSLAGDDVLNSFPNFGGGSLPNGGETVILVGGSGSNDYQIRNNSTAIVIENNNQANNIIWTTIGNENSPGIGVEKTTSFFTEIDNRHLYMGDTNSDQYVILVDWQQPENQIEYFELTEGIIRYTDFASNFRNFNGYQGNISWDKLPEQINLERLGLTANSIENAFERIENRATELEKDDELETIELFRFRNTDFATGTYLFVGEAERNSLESTESSTNSFALDGITPEGTTNPAFTASVVPGDNLLPFFRLSSNDNPGTFLFVSTVEYNTIFAEDSDQKNNWEKQGFDTTGRDIPEFYLYGIGSTTGTEFHRFQNRENGTFLFAGEAETAVINNDPNLSNTFIDQGVAFHALL